MAISNAENENQVLSGVRKAVMWARSEEIWRLVIQRQIRRRS